VKDTKNSLYPEDWKSVAKKDFDRVCRNLNEDDVEAAAFFLQQALEKYLKAFLLERGWELKKIHTLSTLLDYAVEYTPHLEKFRDLCDRASDYYFTERYPQLVPSELTSEDIERDFQEAEEFIKAMFEEE
jgi:HEPN domain-containing protein